MNELILWFLRGKRPGEPVRYCVRCDTLEFSMNAIFAHETNDCKIFAHTAQVHVDNRDYGLAREYITRAENALREADAAMKSGATVDEDEHEDQLETMSDLSDTLQSLEKQLTEA